MVSFGEGEQQFILSQVIFPIFVFSRREIIPFSSWEAPKIERCKCKVFLASKHSFKLHCRILRWFFRVPAIYRQAVRTLQEHLREGTKSRITKPRVQVCIYKCDLRDSTGLCGVQQPRFSSEGAFAEDGEQSKS